MGVFHGKRIIYNAEELITAGYTDDGVYSLAIYNENVSEYELQDVYCLLDDQWDGGGWMLAMKATRGTTFSYNSNYWTTDNTLNPTGLNRDDEDAKFDLFNNFPATDIMAIWPDIPDSGGSISGAESWTWLQEDFNNGTPKALTNFFSSVDKQYISDAKLFDGWKAGVFSSQAGFRWYGFNYNRPGSSDSSVRWGFGWNNETTEGSNDVGGGVGLSTRWDSFSAGDHINCCQDTLGINRSARVEIYVR
jgi:hypothetical protein